MSNFTDGYFINDPAVNLIGDLLIPEMVNPCPPFTIENFNWKPGTPNSVERHSFCVFKSMIRAISLAQEMLDSKIINWSTNSNLKVHPRAGLQFNAFYDRDTLQFFYQKHPKTDKVIYTAESPDVVCHETGHGILDSLRPDIWNVQSLEVFAFHESFADIVSLLVAFRDKSTKNYLLNETGGDLRKSNIVSKIAEELGQAIFAQANQTGDCLRDAVNNFKYIAPERLSKYGSGLTSEPHNFSRVFTGAFYEFIVNLYDNYRSTMESEAALDMAVSNSGRVLFNGVRNAAIQPKFFESVANSMIGVDGVIGDVVSKVFNDRQILNTRASIAKFALTGDFQMSSVQSPKICNLKDEIGIEGNPLYKINIELPHQDSPGIRMVQEITPTEALEAAKTCLDYLHEKDKVGEGKEFEVKDNSLVRRRICIC